MRIEIAWSDEVEEADWIIERLHPFAQDVGSVIPEGFEAYARIFHPTGEVRGGEFVKVRWHEIAARNGRVAHPTMQFHAISTRVGQPLPTFTEAANANATPMTGSLDRDELVALTELLTAATSTPKACWFCVWEGWGDLHPGASRTDFYTRSPAQPASRPYSYTAPPAPSPTTRQVLIPSRHSYLYAGPASAATALLDAGMYHGAQLWWPDDRAWCVSSEIDFAWTYVGGAAGLIDAILADDRFEALPAQITDRATFDSDTINR